MLLSWKISKSPELPNLAVTLSPNLKALLPLLYKILLPFWVSKVTWPPKVVTPAMLTLSKFVCPSTSKSFAILTTPVIVEIPDPPPADPVIVTIPAEAGDTDRLSPKLIVPAVPTVEPLFLTTTPEPEAVIPVNPEPSPTKLVAVIMPVMFILPVPVIDLLKISKLPPSWGVVSSTTLLIPLPPPPEAIVL